MSKINALSKDIPPSETTIQIDVVGEVTKRKYVAEFTCRIPRRKEQCLIDKHRAFLNGSLAEMLDPATLRFHHMISYLRYTIDTESAPKFWKESDLGYELYDENVVVEVYNKVLAFEVDWLKAIWGDDAVAKLQNRPGKDDGAQEQSA